MTSGRLTQKTLLSRMAIILSSAFTKRDIAKFSTVLQENAELVRRNPRFLASRNDLHWAARQGYTEFIPVLLQHGVDVDQLDDRSITALDHAIRNDQVEFVKLLLEQGADPTRRVGLSSRVTALMCAVSSNADIEIVRCILEHDSSCIDVLCDGETPLFRASWRGHVDHVKALIEAGADRSILCSAPSQKTALEIARQFNQPDIVSVLESYEDALKSLRAIEEMQAPGNGALHGLKPLPFLRSTSFLRP